MAIALNRKDAETCAIMSDDMWRKCYRHETIALA